MLSLKVHIIQKYSTHFNDGKNSKVDSFRTHARTKLQKKDRNEMKPVDLQTDGMCFDELLTYTLTIPWMDTSSNRYKFMPNFD